MSGNIYIYIAIVAITSYLIRVLPADADPQADQKPVYPFFPVLCTLCHTCGYDLSGNH